LAFVWASLGVFFQTELFAINVFRPDTFGEGHAAWQTQFDLAAAGVCMLQVDVVALSEQAIDIAAEGAVMVLD
jgi:hypothetical protein